MAIGERDSRSPGNERALTGGGRGRRAAPPAPRPPRRPSRPQHLQDELVGLAEAAGRLAEGLIALLLVGVGREEQQLRQVRGLQAPGLHAHEHLPQLGRAQLQVSQQDGCGRGREGEPGAGPCGPGAGPRSSPGMTGRSLGGARNLGGAGACPEMERVLPPAE